MSLFDVLKYGNTNFNDITEVKKLPEDVIHSVWNSIYPHPTDENINYRMKYLSEGTSYFRKEELYTKFIKVLENRDGTL